MTENEKISYLKRRDGILEVLDELEGHWELAEGLSALIGSEFITPELIDGVEKILEDAIKTVKDDKVLEKLQTGVNIIRQLKEAEKIELSHERNSASQDVLNSFI